MNVDLKDLLSRLAKEKGNVSGSVPESKTTPVSALFTVEVIADELGKPVVTNPDAVCQHVSDWVAAGMPWDQKCLFSVTFPPAVEVPGPTDWVASLKKVAEMTVEGQHMIGYMIITDFEPDIVGLNTPPAGHVAFLMGSLMVVSMDGVYYLPQDSVKVENLYILN